MITIGLTGGIGSGKSTVAKVFIAMRIPVYNSDTRAKLLMIENPKVISAIKILFGNDIYHNGMLNKQKLASIVFNDKAKLSQLNDIVHPAVGEDFAAWQNKQESTIVLKEAAILFETGIYQKLDYTILVTASKEERIKRTISRDNTTREEVIDRMKNQWDDEKKIPLASFVIDNSGEKLVIPQVLEILQKLKK